jgi:hypothetical protein
VTVLLTGGRGVSGPAAAGVAGNVYKNLEAVDYVAKIGTEPIYPRLPSFTMQTGSLQAGVHDK